MLIEPKKICNLSRIPVSLHNSPLAKTCKQIFENDKINYKETYLYNFYKQYQERNLADFYQLDIEKLKNFSYFNSFLPWYHTQPVIKFEDKAFLRQSNDYIDTQVEKIKSLCKSIQRLGYVPENFSKIDRKKGHITGYFLEHENVERFYVVSGNHRVSTHYALFGENKKITVQNEKITYMKDRDKENCGFLRSNKRYPSVFTSSDVKSWPSVKSGFLSKSEALDVFKKYIYS